MDHRICEILEMYNCAVVYTKFQGFIVPRVLNMSTLSRVYQKFKNFKDRDRIGILNN